MDNKPMDSGSNGGAQNANSAASQQQSAQPNSPTPEAMPEWAKKLQSDIDNLRRAEQSEKDRGVSKIAKELESWKPVLEKVKGFVELSPEQERELRREFELDALKAQVFGQTQTQTSAPVSQGSGTPSAAMPGELDILKSFNVDANDSDVLQAIRRAGGNPTALISELHALGITRATQPKPTAASNAAATTGQPVATKTQEEMLQDYTQAMRAARGQPTLLKQIKEDYRKKGLAVDGVVFL